LVLARLAEASQSLITMVDVDENEGRLTMTIGVGEEDDLDAAEQFLQPLDGQPIHR
jgi:hypothetical protein